MVKLHLSHNQKNTEAPPDFVLQTVSGTSRQGSEGDLTSNRNTLPRPSRWKGTEHAGFAHFAVIGRLRLSLYLSSTISALGMDFSNSSFVLWEEISVTVGRSQSTSGKCGASFAGVKLTTGSLLGRSL